MFGLAGTVLVFTPMPAASADSDLLEDFFVKVRFLFVGVRFLFVGVRFLLV